MAPRFLRGRFPTGTIAGPTAAASHFDHRCGRQDLPISRRLATSEIGWPGGPKTRPQIRGQGPLSAKFTQFTS
eukprot:symbB.v1.2.023069.t1/scaffold2086.1/size90009/6